MKFEKLWKLDSKGKLQEWEIEVTASMAYEGPENEVALLITRHGKVGGKIQENTETVTEGKNIGRANQTTPAQQAEAEALSRWEKQVSRKGYTPDRAKAEAGANDQAGVLSPMLAHRFDEKRHKAQYPGFYQTKFDGLRCVAAIRDGEVCLWSREQKPIGRGLLHLKTELKRLFPTGFHILDGEIFNRQVPFEDITSYVKDSEYKAGNESVQYHVYDYPSCPGTFSKRYAAYTAAIKDISGAVLAVDSPIVNDEDEFMELYRKDILHGQEGGIFRNDAEYQQRRTSDLLKMKEMYEEAGCIEEEFPIIGIRAGRGKFAEVAIFTCGLPNGGEFDCNPPGDLESRNKYLLDPTLWQGKLLTVRYGNLTKRGKPRFPVGVQIRELGL